MELKELTGYLDKNLKFTCPERYNFGGIITDLEEVTLKCAYEGWIMFKEVPGFHPIENFKPLLHPLSMLTKEIEYQGERIVPSLEYSYLRFDEISGYKGGANTLNFIQVREYDLLMELHFDFHGLIEKGLAVNKS